MDSKPNFLNSRLLALILPILFLSPLATIAAPGTLSNSPLFATTSAEPNILFVLDDSGSMDWEVMANTDSGVYEVTTNPATGGSIWWFFYNHWDQMIYTYINQIGDNTYSFPYSHLSYVAPTQAYVDGMSDATARNAITGVWRVRSHKYNKIYYNPKVNYTPWAGVDSAGNAYTDANPTQALVNPYYPGNGTINLTTNKTYYTFVPRSAPNYYSYISFSYTIPRYYVTKDDNPANGQVDATDTRKLILIQASTPVCPNGVNASVDEQITNGCMLRSYNEEIKNFANWWQYHRRREYVMKHAMSQIIAPTTGVRMGMFTINHNVSNDRREIASMNADPATGNKRNLLNSLYRVQSSSGTPLRAALINAGNYYICSGTNIFGTQNCPVQRNIVSPATQAAGECQQNFTMLMTDGYYNGHVHVANHDGDGSSYTGVNPVTNTSQTFRFDGAPYADNRTDTLADIAMYYYERDLHSTLANKVPMQCGVDENPGQHMVTYTVSFGVSGSLQDSDIPAHPKRGYAANCTAETPPASPAWPDISTNLGRVDDLRHAAYNGRGQYFNAQNAQALLTSLQNTLKSIVERVGSASAVSFNSTTLDTNTRLYLALFNSTRWSGDLLAYAIDPATGQVSATEDWRAAALLDARTPSSRVMLTYNGTDGVAFQWNNLTTTQKNDLKTSPSGTTENDATGMARLGYLRGDRACESGNTGACSYSDGTNTFSKKIFRARDSRLGDIVHSDPTYIGAPDFGYPDTAPFPSATGSKYSEYVAANKNRKGIVYVGANDGALHGFDASTGEEVLAYVPSYLFSTNSKEGLHYLTDPAYGHRYYVDLPPTRADVFIRTSTSGSEAWRSIIVGGSRAGGRGIFALNVTDPNSFSESGSAPANIALWEFSNADDPNLGYSFSRPQIYLMNNNKWAVVIGNGYNDTGSGEAQLFILFLDTNGALTGNWTLGTDYLRITTKSGTTTDRNGLSTPALIDVDGNGTIDRIYAGDLKGNLWVFDVSGSNPNTWGSAYKQGNNPKPLFTTQANQPITGELEIMSHPTEPNTTAPSNSPNVLVLFGTGQYIVDGDKTSTDTQSFYAVWDKGSLGTGGATLTASDLVQQTFITGTPADIRVTTDNPVDYTTKFGWYINLPTTGERVVTAPLLRGGIIYFNTTIPSVNPCEYGGTGWLMSLDTVNGGPPDDPIFDYTMNNVVDQLDKVTIDGNKYVPVGQKFTQGMPASPTILGDYQYTPGTKTTSGTTVGRRRVQKLSAGQTGRLSWEQLLWQ